MDSQGHYLSPKYSEDPFFKRPGAAERYARWKEGFQPRTDKPFDVPNLTINNKYHNSIVVNSNKSEIIFSSPDSNAARIENKFTNTIYGLNGESKQDYVPTSLFPVVKSRIESKLGLKFR